MKSPRSRGTETDAVVKAQWAGEALYFHCGACRADTLFSLTLAGISCPPDRAAGHLRRVHRETSVDRLLSPWYRTPALCGTDFQKAGPRCCGWCCWEAASRREVCAFLFLLTCPSVLAPVLISVKTTSLWASRQTPSPRIREPHESEAALWSPEINAVAGYLPTLIRPAPHQPA